MKFISVNTFIIKDKVNIELNFGAFNWSKNANMTRFIDVS